MHQRAVVITPGLNVHLLPGTGNPYDAVPKDTVLIVHGRRDKGDKYEKDWLYVHIPARQEYGWVIEEAVRYEADPPPRPASPPGIEPGPVNAPGDTEIVLPAQQSNSMPWLVLAVLVIVSVLVLLFGL